MTQRIEMYGQWISSIGENIDYGTKTGAEDVVISLVVDDGVPSRGHRTNIFNPQFTHLGAWTGGHGLYGSMTTIDYCGASIRSNNKYALTPDIA